MKEIFHGKIHELLRILGKTYMVDPKCLKTKILVWDLDEKGNPQKDENGEVKTKEITCIISIDVWCPNDVSIDEVEK